MSSDCSFLFIPSTSVLSFQILLCFLLFVAVFGFWLTPGGLAWALSKAHTRTRTAIPGPSGLPLLGLALSFTNPLTHRNLSKLSRKLEAKSLMAFSVGLTRFVISSSPETAKEILNSSAFADRPVKESAYGLLFHRAMGFAPYGEYWRNLRRISATHLFSPKRVACFGDFRKEIGMKMVGEIMVKMEKYCEVEVKSVFHFGSLNNVMMSVFGKWYDFSGENGDGLELEDEHKVKRAMYEGVEFGDDDQHSHDFVDVLLDLEKENRLSDSDMIAVLWIWGIRIIFRLFVPGDGNIDIFLMPMYFSLCMEQILIQTCPKKEYMFLHPQEMIFRGTDTVAILLEWILARMILHPDIQSKAQDEIDSVIGTNTTVSDYDLPNMPYLLAIVKETLRLHPPGPLLSWARLSIHDNHVGPHFIPAGTTAMVNMWAITHDDKVWPEPEKFRPERFLEEDVATMGSDLRLAPFGSGRRVCPGKTMGLATVQLWLAQLLHKFRWIASSNCGVDLAECLKLSMEMKHPLVCKAILGFLEEIKSCHDFSSF
ncbi:hypothetical protein DH2020_038087 [Rehmannia glutinosa]|uniref:Uncharacterized protein n=1 Tax=Rehmannia glutinosa TaxID=99300 RepID=A0ABR0UZK0_REHGL